MQPSAYSCRPHGIATPRWFAVRLSDVACWLQGYIEVNNSWNLYFDRFRMDILQRTGPLVMLVSRHPGDLPWNKLWQSGHVIRIALLFPTKWWSRCWFCVVQVDQTYQPHHQRPSFSPCGRRFATSNISPNNIVNIRIKVRALKKIHRPPPMVKYDKLKKRSTQPNHQGYASKSGLNEDKVLALGTLRGLRSKKELLAENDKKRTF